VAYNFYHLLTFVIFLKSLVATYFNFVNQICKCANELLALLQMACSYLRSIESWGPVDILSGLHLLPMLVIKCIRRNGILLVILPRTFVGSCSHNRIKQLCGRRLLKGVAIILGKFFNGPVCKYHALTLQFVLAGEKW